MDERNIISMSRNRSEYVTLWKSSNWTPATAPRMREAMALHASPTKSGTANIFEDSLSSSLLTSKCLQEESREITPMGLEGEGGKRCTCVGIV